MPTPASAGDEHGVEPMLATLTREPFSRPGWLFERKLDGVRALAVREGGRTRLFSRTHKPMGASYPEIVDALEVVADGDFATDGEIVAFDGDQTSFAMLQKRIHQTNPVLVRSSGVAVFYYVFDMLSWDGHDMRRLPLRDRKTILREAIDFADPLRYSAHRDADGAQMYADACARGWEGVIAKRADSAYRGGRSPDWLKFKCVRDQDVVIGGFTDPSGSRSALGALLVGYHDDSGLRYAGKVGTGFDEATLRRLRDLLGPLEQPASPFVDQVREKGAHWVAAQVVAQVGFAEWTTAGHLRHPTYRGLRDDRSATDVVREAPAGGS